METLGSISFWLNFNLFFIALLVSVLFPGLIIIRNIRFLDNSTKILVSLVTGVVLWSAQGYIFGYLHLRFFTYIYIFITFYLGYKYRNSLSNIIINSTSELKTVSKKILFLIFIGTIVQVIPVIGSGLKYKEGIRFFGVNGFDGVMHLSFIQSIVSSFPPQEPGAVGNLITNYHYWSDLFFAELVRIWHIPVSYIFFQYTPPIISILTAIALYKLLKIWTSDYRVHLAGLFFLYFGGDTTYLFMLILHKTFGFTTPAIDNGAAQFLNMPHAMAKMIFFTGLLIMQYWIKTKKKAYGILAFILLAALTGFKVYFAIFSLIGICSLTLYTFLSTWFKANRKALNYIPNAITATRSILPLIGFSVIFFILFLMIFLPPNKNSGGLFYSPLEWSKILLGSSGINFKLWWYYYNNFLASNNTSGLVLLNTIAIIITLISIHGTRLIGFFISPKTYRVFGGENIAFLVPALLIFQILGLTTLQISGGLNVFNFFAVSTVALAIFSSFVLIDILNQKSKLSLFLFTTVILLTVPRSLHEVLAYTKGYFTTGTGSYTISNNELEALNFIKEHTSTDTVIQSHPQNHLDSRVSYVAYFTNRNTYLTGIQLQETHNQPIKDRKVDLTKLFSSPNSMDFNKGLEERKIGLFYFQKNLSEQSLLFTPTEGHFNVFFENNDIIVYDPKEGL